MARKSKLQGLHRDNQLRDFAIVLGGEDYMATVLSNGTYTLVVNADGSINVRQVPPSTVAIVEKITSTDGWEAVATGLTGVRKWRLSNTEGRNFDYAFTATPATAYSTAFGSIDNETGITAIYARRQGDTELTLHLETWS